MEKDKFINDVIECFDNKINIIRNIVYNYNLLDIIPNLTTMSDDEKKQKLENIINFYLEKIQKSKKENIIQENRRKIDDILDFFDYSYFDTQNKDVLSVVQEEAETITDSFVEKLFTKKGNKLLLPIKYDFIKSYCITSSVDKKYTDYVFLWIILKLSITYNFIKKKIKVIFY